MTFRDLKLRLRALIRPRRVERELQDELAFHLERETRKLTDEGMAPEEARARARARFGSPSLSADECRDARGTGLVDDVVRDVVYAIRTFRHAPLAALTIVATVAIGLGLVAVVFTVFNLFVFRTDDVSHPGELFAVERPDTNGERLRFTTPQFEALRRETSVFVDAFAILPDIDSRIDGRMMSGTLVTGNFFQVLGVKAALGRALVPADNDKASGRPPIVLSHRGWTRHFDNDPSVIGRNLQVNGYRYEVVGVMPDGFRGLSVGPPDYWAPLALLGQFRIIHAGREDMVGIEVIGRLKQGVSRRSAETALNAWDSAGVGVNRRPPSLTLVPSQGTIPHPAEAVIVFTPLFFVFGLILLIGCANVANLLLARAVARQREIGMRLALGASRRRIIRQLLTESLLLALASAALGFAISRIVLNATVYAVGSTIAPEVAEFVSLAAPAADWRVLLFLAGGAIVATAFFGLAPAMRATRLDLVRTIRGEITTNPRPSRARNLLIGVQVTASTLLLICSAVFLRSAMASSASDPGIRTADTIAIDLVNESARTATIEAVKAMPTVMSVAASWPDVFGRPRAAFAVTPAGTSSIAYKFVSPEYFDVLGIDIVNGRGFTAQEQTGSSAVLVSESTARQLWPAGDALGQVLRIDPDPSSESQRTDEPALLTRTFTVVGIARDVAGFRLADFKEAGVYVPTGFETPKSGLVVRVHGDSDRARRELLTRLTAIDPNMATIMTMRTMAKMDLYMLQVAFWLTLVLGGLALVLTLCGLFSVLTYLVAQRTREIGVRLALGATSQRVAALVLSQSVRPVVIGLAIGAGVAGSAAIGLLALPGAEKIGSIVHVLDPIAYGASIVCIIATCLLAALIPALRAARIDPIRALRQE